MTTSSISVVITTHNRLALLQDALQSLELQGLAPREVVVVDDGRTLNVSDNEELERRFPLVRVLPVDHGGVSRARNFGAQHTTGSFLVFLDDDDELTPIAIEEFTRLHQAFPEAIALVGSSQPFSTSGERVLRSLHPNPATLREDLWRQNPICSGGSVAVAREALMRVGGWDNDLVGPEDYMLWLKLSQVGDFAVSNQILFRYRQHGETLSSGGKLYFSLPAFKQAFRRNFPALIRSKREDTVLSGLVLAEGTNALWQLRSLILQGRLGEAFLLLPQILRGTMIAIESPRRAGALCKAVYRTTVATVPEIVRGGFRRILTHRQDR